MKPFLQLVAEDLQQKFGLDFSRVVIVFPNKRAGLFMNEHLLNLAGDTPVWAPRYVTINDLFLSLAPDLSINDPIDTTLRIVMLFRRLTGRDVSVDWFYGWAERLLADFDDVDKNMADARKLFQNVSDWKQFDDTSFLTEEQVKQLQRFFAEFDPERKSEIKENYRQLWDVLYEMYDALNRDLASQKLAYEGALYRRVVERLYAGEADLDSGVEKYVIVGFNVLDDVEQRLFKYLQKEGKALFYWDYDEYYTDAKVFDEIDVVHHEAGAFLRNNLKMFKSELGSELFCNLRHPKRLEMVAASTEAIQAQFVAPWLDTHLTPDHKQTAIVLCNENLLQPVLHGLPDSVDELNVTKGFPLSHTEVVTRVEHQLGEWERRKTQAPLLELLAKLSNMVDEEGRAFVAREDYNLAKFEDVLQGEAYYQMFTVLNRFARIIGRYADDEQMTIVTLRRLIRSVVRQASIPFEGEPAVGLQIMGVLETRCLDFERVLLLSANDGVLPRKAADNSFIPYILRRAFHLTTPERRTGVYAYYFYRLLQRAEVVTMTYNTSTEGMSTGEMSRFMTQLLVEWPHRVEHYSLNSNQRTVVGSPEAADKPADLMARLTKEGARLPTLSPSGLQVYLNCQLKFYYKYVLGIQEPTDTSEGMPPNVMGDIFHRAAELIYKERVDNHNGQVEPDWLKAMVRDKGAIRAYVKQAFEDVGVEYRLLEGRVLELFVKTLLAFDARQGHFRVVGTERSVACFVEAHRGGETVSLRIGGKVDRLDLIRGDDGQPMLRVLDYKTGSCTLRKGWVEKASAGSIDELFAPGSDKGYMLQTMLYNRMLRTEAHRDVALEQYMAYPVAPALLFIRRANHADYDPRLKIGDAVVTDSREYEAAFDEHLRALLDEILDPTTQFRPTEDQKNKCPSCPYRSICHRVKNEVENTI